MEPEPIVETLDVLFISAGGGDMDRLSINEFAELIKIGVESLLTSFMLLNGIVDESEVIDEGEKQLTKLEPVNTGDEISFPWEDTESDDKSLILFATALAFDIEFLRLFVLIFGLLLKRLMLFERKWPKSNVLNPIIATSSISSVGDTKFEFVSKVE